MPFSIRCSLLLSLCAGGRKLELDADAQPAHMIINSREMRGVAKAGREVKAEFLPPALEDAGRGPRTRSAGVLAAQGMVYVLRSDLDNTWRERCE